jgi:hypothetical protein
MRKRAVARRNDEGRINGELTKLYGHLAFGFGIASSFDIRGSPFNHFRRIRVIRGSNLSGKSLRRSLDVFSRDLLQGWSAEM